MELTGIRNKVFLDRYALKDENGNPIEKVVEEMWRRVAKGVSIVEKKDKKKEWEEKFYQAMSDFKYVPGGRILSGAGTGFKVTFYNCYVLPSPKDSRDGILDNLKQMVEIMARGGGVGINLSSLRPRGARVKKVNGFSSGPMNWAELYSVATHDIIQQGGTRRGALMLMLWDWHPDIEEFITVKKNLARIQGANLSVCVSDTFMEAVKNDDDWNLVYPDLDDPDYDSKWAGYMPNWTKEHKKVKVYKTIKARYLWDLICEAAWNSAEPGVVFMERYNKWHSNSYFNTINCVNPCGEEGLPAYGVCNLGSVNLSAMITEKGEMDYKSLEETVRAAVRLQDNVIDSDIYIFPEIRETQLNGERRIGLGTMGLGDALIKMKIRYGSEESLPVIDKIFKFIRDIAYDESVELAREKGPFAKFDAKEYPKGLFIKELPEKLQAKIKKYGIRNSVVLMQAPTGTTSLLAGTTSGIEPVYEFSFIRKSRLGEDKIYHPLFDAWRKDHEGEPIPSYFVSANDLTPEDHVQVQAIIQKYVDASISKTVNAPKTFTVADVKKLYTLAYELGCKGITFMREGSRPGVLEREPKKEDKPAEQPTEVMQMPMMLKKTPRPTVVRGATYQVQTPVGIAYLTINSVEDNQPLEVFLNIGKAGSDVAAMAEALGRVISLNLRMASPLSSKERMKLIFNELIGIGGSRSLGFGPNRVRSLPDALAKAIAQHFEFTLKNGNGHAVGNGNGHTEGIEANPEAKALLDQRVAELSAQSIIPMQVASAQTQLPFVPKHMDLCPECGEATLAHEEGCAKCYSCGHSMC